MRWAESLFLHTNLLNGHTSEALTHASMSSARAHTHTNTYLHVKHTHVLVCEAHTNALACDRFTSSDLFGTETGLHLKSRTRLTFSTDKRLRVKYSRVVVRASDSAFCVPKNCTSGLRTQETHRRMYECTVQAKICMLYLCMNAQIHSKIVGVLAVPAHACMVE